MELRRDHMNLLEGKFILSLNEILIDIVLGLLNCNGSNKRVVQRGVKPRGLFIPSGKSSAVLEEL